MWTIKPLEHLNREDLTRLIVGYISHEKYEVQYSEADAKIVFALERVALETPYIKHYDHLNSDTLDFYQAVLQEGFSLGAYEGEALVGIALVVRQAWNISLVVHELHVAESHRGQGIGQALMEVLIERARAVQCRMIVCETQNTNGPALRFYRRMGFAVHGIDLSLYSNQDWPDGEVAIFMKLLL